MITSCRLLRNAKVFSSKMQMIEESNGLGPCILDIVQEKISHDTEQPNVLFNPSLLTSTDSSMKEDSRT